jgi:hypothetical protein
MDRASSKHGRQEMNKIFSLEHLMGTDHLGSKRISVDGMIIFKGILKKQGVTM